MKKYCIILVLLFSTVLFSQKKESRFDMAFSPEVIYAKQFVGGFNFTIGEFYYGPYISAISALRFGVESNFKKGEDFIVAPKLGYELSVAIFIFRITALSYIQNGRSELRLIPEIGFSTFGFFNLTYGYSLKLNNENITDIGNHRLGLSINFNKKLTNEVFP